MTDTEHDKLRNAFDRAGFSLDTATITINTTPHIADRVGDVTIDQDGASLTLNDPEDDTIDTALGYYGWEAATVRLTEDGIVISVWEAQR